MTSFRNASNVPLLDIAYSFKDEQTSQILFKIISDLCNLDCFLWKRSKMTFLKQSKTVSPKSLILFENPLAEALSQFFVLNFLQLGKVLI